MEALQRDYRSAEISAQDRTMLDYVVKLTKDATKVSPDDHAKLRAVGFDDRGILQITLIASWFNYEILLSQMVGVWSSAGRIRPSRSCSIGVFQRRTDPTEKGCAPPL